MQNLCFWHLWNGWFFFQIFGFHELQKFWSYQTFSWECIWGIPAQCCWVSQKTTVHEVWNFEKNFLRSISPKITEKTENDTLGRYRFRWNCDSKFDVRRQIFWAMGESGCGFGLEVMRKSKWKKKLKTKWTKIIEYDGS